MNDSEVVKTWVDVNNLPGERPKTADQIVEYANIIAMRKQFDQLKVNKTHFRGAGRKQTRGRGRGNYHKNHKQSGRKACTACGYDTHTNTDKSCPARGQICRNCNLKNHFASVCFSKRGQHQQSRGSTSHHHKSYRNKKAKEESENSAKDAEKNHLANLLARE